MASSIRGSSRGWAALRKKHRRKTRGPRGLRGRCLEAQNWEGDVRAAALDSGLSLRVNVVRCGRNGQTLHWMFDDVLTGRRVLDYWPSRGTTYNPLTRQKGRVADWWAALDEAQRTGVRLHGG